MRRLRTLSFKPATVSTPCFRFHSRICAIRSCGKPLPAHLKRLARKGIATMAALHNVPWEPRRGAWSQPFALSEELNRLDYLLDRPTLDPAVVARAPELRERLHSSLPANARIGCVHGDFQWSNVLFNEERVR